MDLLVVEFLYPSINQVGTLSAVSVNILKMWVGHTMKRIEQKTARHVFLSICENTSEFFEIAY